MAMKMSQTRPVCTDRYSIKSMRSHWTTTGSITMWTVHWPRSMRVEVISLDRAWHSRLTNTVKEARVRCRMLWTIKNSLKMMAWGRRATTRKSNTWWRRSWCNKNSPNKSTIRHMLRVRWRIQSSWLSRRWAMKSWDRDTSTYRSLAQRTMATFLTSTGTSKWSLKSSNTPRKGATRTLARTMDSRSWWHKGMIMQWTWTI